MDKNLPTALLVAVNTHPLPQRGVDFDFCRKFGLGLKVLNKMYLIKFLLLYESQIYAILNSCEKYFKYYGIQPTCFQISLSVVKKPQKQRFTQTFIFIIEYK
jgi:hypothetical protein